MSILLKGARPGESAKVRAPTHQHAHFAHASLAYVVGTFGTVHPEGLGNFDLDCPSAAIDVDLEYFL